MTNILAAMALTAMMAFTNDVGMMTNSSINGSYILATSSNTPIDSVEYMIENGTLTNVIKRLAEEGYICGVYGHQYSRWHVNYHLGTMYRTCGICGKHESYLKVAE